MSIHTRLSAGFSGSYDPADITFLLRNVAITSTSIEEKERAIQQGTRHYSEMISEEKAPSEAYMETFMSAMSAGAARLGRDISMLALALDRQVSGPIVLASLVRAGAPAGVLLARALRHLGREVYSYGISIIRDKGLDDVAMRYILERHPIEGLVFVDGWTGKGAISSQLEDSFKKYSSTAPRLVVVADPCGRAWLAASGDDWLIPSGILGSTVSGLISRTILTEEISASGGFHGCKMWDNLSSADNTMWFIEEVMPHVLTWLDMPLIAEWTAEDRERHAHTSQKAVRFVAETHDVTNLNRIKPGIAEATRAILRRMPQFVYISSINDPDLQAMVHLLKEKQIPFKEMADAIAPYRAITLISKVS